MSDAGRTGTHLEAAAGTAGTEAVDALRLLAEETRLAILLALWEEYDPHADDNVPFSRLFERTGYRSRGNFSYHLQKLEGMYIKQHEERGGYELTRAGLKLVRTIIAGVGIEDTRLEPSAIDVDCPLCGATTTVSYRDGLLFWSCTACQGVAPDEIETEGALALTDFEPAGLTDRSPGELHAASEVASQARGRSLFDGVCPTCTGTVDSWMEVCPDHDAEGVCQTCGKPSEILCRFRCRTCRQYGVTPPKRLALYHPAVVAFYHDHGISTRVRADNPESAERILELVLGHEQRLVSEDPPRATVTATMNGEELTVTFDETAKVVDVSI